MLNLRKKLLLLQYERVFDELQLELELIDERGIPPLSRSIAESIGYPESLGWAGIF